MSALTWAIVGGAAFSWGLIAHTMTGDLKLSFSIGLATITSYCAAFLIVRDAQ